MTKLEKLIVSAYTGILMCDMDEFHAFAEKVLKHPIYTHEFAETETWDELRRATKQDFLLLCKTKDSRDN